MGVRVFRLGKTLIDLSHKVKFQLNSRVSREYPDLNGFQMRLLTFLEHNAEMGVTVCQRDIEKEFNIKGSTVTSVLNNMEKNDYITRQTVPGDKRRKAIVATRKTAELGGKTRSMIDDFETRLQKNLTNRELSTLRYLLKKVEKTIDE